MIVGFPGETAADFDETLTLTEAVGYHSMFSFKYSPRPNTLAAKRLPDEVPEEEKTRRIVALQALQRDDSDASERGAGRPRGGRARRCGKPAARDRTVGPDEQQRGGEPARSGGVDRPDGQRAGRAGRSAQRVGPRGRHGGGWR